MSSDLTSGSEHGNMLVAQAQAKHDVSQLFISHADDPFAVQEHVEDEQTIFDLDEEGEEEEDSEDVEGPVDSAAVSSSTNTTPHPGGAQEHKRVLDRFLAFRIVCGTGPKA